MPFLPPNQQRQSTEGTVELSIVIKRWLSHAMTTTSATTLMVSILVEIDVQQFVRIVCHLHFHLRI